MATLLTLSFRIMWITHIKNNVTDTHLWKHGSKAACIKPDM